MTYTLYYWAACKKFWGRALPIVLTLNHAGKELVIKDQTETPPPADAIVFASPIVTLENGHTMSQLPAILDVLGEKTNLRGKTEHEVLATKQVLLDLDDMFDEQIAKKWDDKKERKDKWLSLLEKRLSKTKYLTSEEPTVADFHAVLTLSKMKGDFDAAKYPKFASWFEGMDEIPAVKKIRESGIPIAP